jgi:hypothetical protein
MGVLRHDLFMFAVHNAEKIYSYAICRRANDLLSYISHVCPQWLISYGSSSSSVALQFLKNLGRLTHTLCEVS